MIRSPFSGGPCLAIRSAVSSRASVLGRVTGSSHTLTISENVKVGPLRGKEGNSGTRNQAGRSVGVIKGARVSVGEPA